MKTIQDLCDKIEEELNDACSYIDMALNIMATDKDTAALYAQLSSDEMVHSDKLHNRVVAMIQEYRKEKGEPPEKMMWRYEYEHEKFMHKALTIKIKQALYKEGIK